MSRPSKKEQIVNIVFDQLPAESKRQYETLTNEQMVFRWFTTGRGGDGLRLTDEGMAMFLAANIAHYDFILFDLEYNTNSFNATAKKFLKNVRAEYFTINLNKKIKCPYFLGMRTSNKNPEIYVRVYDHKVAMMISIYGSIEEYLDSVSS